MDTWHCETQFNKVGLKCQQLGHSSLFPSSSERCFPPKNSQGRTSDLDNRAEVAAVFPLIVQVQTHDKRPGVMEERSCKSE